MTGMGAGLTWGSALIRWTKEMNQHEQDRVLLPGPGVDRGGDGLRHRAGRAAGDGDLRAREPRVGARPRAALLPRRRRRSSSTRRSSSRRSSRRRSRCSPRSASAGSSPTTSSAIPSASSRRSPPRTRCRWRKRSRSCASAASRWPKPLRRIPGSMAAILGLEDEVVETLCRQILGVWPANYNCPGPDRRLGREQRRRRVHRARAGGGRAAHGEAQGVGRVPLAARRARRRPAAPCDREGEVPGADGAVHVDRDRAPRVGAADGAAARRPADGAGPVHAGGVRADEGRREDVRRGRPGQRAVGARAPHRPQRQGDLGQQSRCRSTSCPKHSPRT